MDVVRSAADLPAPVRRRRRLVALPTRGAMTSQGPHAFVPYEAASMERARAGWTPALGSADQMLLPHLPLMRARSRDAARNGLGAGLIKTLVDYIIGDRGIVRQARLDAELFGGDEERARRAEQQLEYAHARRAAVADWTGRQDAAGLQRQVCRSWLVDGEAIANLVLGDDGEVKVELVDADRLLTPPGQALRGLIIRDGVEYDVRGIPVAYWIATQHPNEGTRVEYRKIPRFTAAGDPQLLHVFDPLRVSQSRGEPRLTACLDRLDDLAEFLRCKLFQARTDAMHSYWVQSDAGAYEDAVQSGEEDEEGRTIEDIEYGATRYLRPGESIVVPESARPGAELENFRSAIHSEVAASTGLTVELVAKDFTKTTWHSARQSSLEVMRTIRADQALLVRQFIRPLDELWCRYAILSGEVEEITPAMFFENPSAFLQCSYQAPVRGLVDPSQENNASEMALRLSLSTLADECAARGRDWQEVVDQQAREKAYRQSKGVEPTAPDTPAQDPEEEDEETEGDQEVDPAEGEPVEETE